MDRDFKGIWIPKEIYLDTNLNWTEKILLLEIDSLDGTEGCFATNEHFARHLMISKDRVSKLISKLNSLGYITVQIIYKNSSKQIEKRILHSTIGYSRKKLEGIGENNDRSIGENNDRSIGENNYTPIGENDQDNNTKSNNTKSNNNKKEKKETALDLIIKNYTDNPELKETLQDFLKMRKAQKKAMTDRGLKTLLNKLNTLATTDAEKIERLEESICNCWLTVYPKKQYNNSYSNRTNLQINKTTEEDYEQLRYEITKQYEEYEKNKDKIVDEYKDIDF